MTKFVESIYVTKMREVTRESYERYWDERNGGNVSLRLTGEEVSSFEDVTEVKEVLENFVKNKKGMEAHRWCSAVEYLLRYAEKNGGEDLKKARKNIEWLIES